MGKVNFNLFSVAKISAAFCGLGCLIVLYIYARKVFPDQPKLAAWTTLLLTLDPWFIRWCNSGMESSSALFFIILIPTLQTSLAKEKKLPWWFFLICSIAVLVRIELWIFMAGFALHEILSKIHFFRNQKPTTTRKQKVFLNIIAFSALPLIWSLIAFWQFGTFIPQTIRAKGLSRPFLAGLLDGFWQEAKFFLSCYSIELLIIFIAFLFLFKDKKFLEKIMNSSAEVFIRYFWLLALPIFYLIGSARITSRYLLLLSPFIIISSFKFLEAYQKLNIWNFKAFQKSKLILFILIAMSIEKIIFGIFAVYPNMLQTAKNLDQSLKPLALWIKDNTTPESTIAAEEIGILGYFSDRYIIDLDGLVTPGVLAYTTKAKNYTQRLQGFFEFIRQIQPDYWVIVSDQPKEYDFMPLDLVKVFQPIFAVAFEGGTQLRNPQTYYKVLYKLNWKKPVLDENKAKNVRPKGNSRSMKIPVKY